MYEETRSIDRHLGSGHPSKVVAQVMEVVEQEMQRDDKTMMTQLRNALATENYALSKQTVLQCRWSLEWMHQGSAYCQLIIDINKEKRLEWAKVHVRNERNMDR